MISIFASGLSVLDIPIDTLIGIKTDSKIVTTNYPLTLIDERITSDYHAFGDTHTCEYANENFASSETKLITRDVIALNYSNRLKNVKIWHVINASEYEPYNQTTFLLVLQFMLDSFRDEKINVYGLDFEIPKGSKYIRWYDKYIAELNGLKPKFTNETYEFRMLKRLKSDGYASDNFKKTFDEFIIFNEHILERVSFYGKYKPLTD